MQPTGRWLNQAQPQTLVIATWLLYFDAAFGALGLLAAPSVIGLAVVAASAAGGYGIANDRKWGYWLAVGVSAFALLPYALALVAGANILAGGMGMIGLMFAIAQMALLLHPMSRNYQRTWFR